jgi:four helix bundle protein
MRDFRKLQVWRKAHEVTLAVYKASRQSPQNELYGLTSQARRSAASIPANIADGCGRSGEGDFARFLQIASGSANELECHLLLAHDLHLLDSSIYERLTRGVCEVKKMLTSLIGKLKPER